MANGGTAAATGLSCAAAAASIFMKIDANNTNLWDHIVHNIVIKYFWGVKTFFDIVYKNVCYYCLKYFVNYYHVYYNIVINIVDNVNNIVYIVFSIVDNVNNCLQYCFLHCLPYCFNFANNVVYNFFL